MNKVSSNVRPYLLDWFKECFMTAFDSDPYPNEETRIGKDKENYVVKEKRQGLSTKQLADVMKEKGECISTDDLRNRYLYPLINQGIIDSQYSVIDSRQHIYFPTGSHEDNLFGEGVKLKVESSVYPTSERIRESFEKIRRYKNTFPPKIVFENREIEMTDLVEMYLRTFVSCFEENPPRFKHPLGHFSDLPTTTNKADGNNVKLKPLPSGPSPLVRCHRLVTERVTEFNLLERYGLDIEFDDYITDRTPTWLGFNFTTYTAKVILKNETEIATQTGYFALPLNRVVTANELVALIVATVTMAIVRTKKHPHQQLVMVERPSSLTQQLIQVPSQPYLRPPPLTLVKNVPELGKFATFDCEWHFDNSRNIGNVYAFCLINDQGQTKLHIQHYNGNGCKFMSAILDVMEQYTALAGYSISSNENRHFYSDIYHLENSCRNAGLLDRFLTLKSKIKFLDAGEIFNNNVIKGFLKATYAIVYRGGLDEVAGSYIGKGKTEGVSGVNVESFPVDKQLDYCLRDAELCYELLQKNDFELLHILYEISQEVKLSFFDTCNTQYPTRWWRSKLTSIGYKKVNPSVQQWIDENTTSDSDGKKSVKYLGAHVAEPKVGRYLNAASYDVSSMYPTMIVVHNISTDTVNCDCCHDDPNARIPDQVMKSINDYVLDPKNKAKKREARPWHYWICKKRRGQLSEVMSNLMDLKRQYKQSGQKLKEKAIKILMNSGYGCFGNTYFEYRDPRVAELITGYGQFTIKQLQEYANDKMIYGDTDSIYLVSKDDTIITKAAELDVTLEFERWWKGLFLTPNKKQYFGITQEGKVVRKTLYGMKNSQPAFFNDVTEKLISKESMELFINDANTNNDPLDKILSYIRSAFVRLTESVGIDQLAFSQEAKKALYEYKNNGKERQMYKEILEDCGGDIELAQSRSQPNNVYEYWKIIGEKGKSVTRHPERYQLNMTGYRMELFKCIEPIIQAYGMEEENIDKLHIELTGQKRLHPKKKGDH